MYFMYARLNQAVLEESDPSEDDIEHNFELTTCEYIHRDCCNLYACIYMYTYVYVYIHLHVHIFFLARTPLYPSVVSPCVAIAATKVIVSVPQLLQLVPKICLVKKCSGSVTIHQQFVGATLVLIISCSSGHSYVWYSSPQHLNKVGYRVFYNNVLVAASVLLSGNAYDKIVRMMKFMGVKCMTNSSFYRYQSLYFIPSINKFWSQHQSEVLAEHMGRDLVVFGDGRCDSPGSSAALSTYTIMDNDSGAILSTITVTKSEVRS